MLKDWLRFLRAVISGWSALLAGALVAVPSAIAEGTSYALPPKAYVACITVALIIAPFSAWRRALRSADELRASLAAIREDRPCFAMSLRAEGETLLVDVENRGAPSTVSAVIVAPQWRRDHTHAVWQQERQPIRVARGCRYSIRLASLVVDIRGYTREENLDYWPRWYEWLLIDDGGEDWSSASGAAEAHEVRAFGDVTVRLVAEPEPALGETTTMLVSFVGREAIDIATAARQTVRSTRGPALTKAEFERDRFKHLRE
jgi:hypothetical protein